LVDDPNALEERVIEKDRVVVRGELRRLLTLNLLQCVVGVRRRDGTEGLQHPSQQLARSFERDQRVVERRRIHAVGDLVDLAQLATHSLLDRRREILVANPIERRGTKGKRAPFGKRVVGGEDRGLSRCARGRHRIQSYQLSANSESYPKKRRT